MLSTDDTTISWLIPWSQAANPVKSSFTGYLVEIPLLFSHICSDVVSLHDYLKINTCTWINERLIITSVCIAAISSYIGEVAAAATVSVGGDDDKAVVRDDVRLRKSKTWSFTFAYKNAAAAGTPYSTGMYVRTYKHCLHEWAFYCAPYCYYSSAVWLMERIWMLRVLYASSIVLGVISCDMLLFKTSSIVFNFIQSLLFSVTAK